MKPPFMDTAAVARTGLFLVLVAGTPAATASTEINLWGKLPEGPHAVGFRTFESKAIDLLPSLPGRTTEIALWYPAKPSAAPALRFEDYFKLAPDLRRRSAPAGVSPDDLPRVLSAAMTGDAQKTSGELLAAALAAPLRGVREAEKAGGRFPIVIWSSRYGTTAAQCVLSEFLASHGFLVAFARPKPPCWTSSTAFHELRDESRRQTTVTFLQGASRKRTVASRTRSNDDYQRQPGRAGDGGTKLDRNAAIPA
jgi:hypothetical protein